MNPRFLNGRGEAGFTLLELLISMTLLGLLMVVVLGGLRFGARAWERNEAHATATDEIRLAQSLLRQEIARAYPLFLMDQAHLENRHVDFEGTESRMSFLVLLAPEVVSDIGGARITLQSVERNGRLALIYAAQPELAADSQAHSEVLVDRLRSVTFSYFGSGQPSEPALWHDQWVNKKSMPELIRVHATFPDGDARTWPELVVAPRISVDVSCVYDPLVKYCQGRK